jgi:NAD(P)-dependent dehydrogenase (short-subunit alcohol dehydrogenase family)
MAIALAQAGADVVCAARTLEQVERTAADIRSLGRRAVAQSTDVRDSSQCDALIARASQEFGRLDIMLSNAGIGDMRGANAKLSDVSDDDWHDTLDVNLSSAFYCARAASKQMIEEGHGGVIINVASGTAMRGYPMSFGYGAAKAGVIALTKSLAQMLQPAGIRVNCIIPGFVRQAPARNEREEIFARTQGQYIPAQRLGAAWELGPLAIYLASEASAYVTGQGFVIDGGGLAAGVAPTGFAPEVPV